MSSSYSLSVEMKAGSFRTNILTCTSTIWFVKIPVLKNLMRLS